jgi:hypothetical protein
MRIKMKQVITGLRDGVSWPAIGGTLVVPDAEGAQLCGQGIAEPVAEAPAPEKREIPAKKTAARRG